MNVKPPLRYLSSPIVLFAIFVGIIFTLALVSVTYWLLLKQESDTYNAKLLLIKEQVVRNIDAIDEVIHGVRVLFDASTEVDSDEFRLIAEDVLSRHSHIVSVSYLPRVSLNNKAAFEKKIRDRGYIDFSIYGEGMTHNKADPGLDAFPVLYHEPFTPGTAKWLGFDYLSSDALASTIVRAVETSLATSSVYVPLRTDGHDFVVIKAIYAGKDTPKTVPERRDTVNGLVSMRIDATKILSTEFMSDISVRLRLLGERGGDIIQSEVERYKYRMISPTWLSNTYDFNSGADRYRLEVKMPMYLAEANFVLLAGVFIVGVLIAVLLVLQAKNIVDRTFFLQRRHAEVQELAEERTKELAREKERAQITLESIADAVITTNEQGKVDYLNPVAEKLTGWSEKDALNQDIGKIFCLENAGDVANLIMECLRSSSVVKVRETVCVVGRRGEKTSAEVAVAPIVSKDGQASGAVLVSHDVSLAKLMASQMEFQATHDSLTTLPNRALLIDRLKQAISRAPWNSKYIAVLFLDLDRFKLVNDTRGHDIGDELLQQVANRLSSCLRKGDTVSRLGGDEFVIVLHDLARIEDIQGLAEKIISVFRRPFQLSVEEFFTTASMGISIHPRDGDDPFILMKKADSAMYRAKAAGKNNFVFYDEEMSAQNEKMLAIEIELRRALEKSEFELYYQPQVDMSTGAIIGAEALVRWKHPELGVVSPMEFIPVAEETGLIIPLGRWVIQTACHHRQQWYELGNKDIRVSVNISGVQFQNGSLFAEVDSVLRQTGLNPNLLELELTEGVLAKDSEGSAATLDRLKSMGVHMSIDDFGTGYSSLAYLKRFPMSTLKVDRCFVKDITTDSDDAAICSAVIAMAHNLNLRVIAEGVEDRDQLTFLKTHECDAVQGYYFSRPLPEDEFRSLLLGNEVHFQVID